VITDVNPFVYSRPIAPDEVIDRDDETQKLLRWAVGGHYVRLFAPRKYGKTSLLGRVLRDGERSEGLVPIIVDLYGVLSVADVTVRVERAYARQLKGRLRARVDEFLQSTGLGLSLGAYGVSAKLQLDPRLDPLPALHALLDLPLRLTDGGGARALIVFDEFQDVAKVGRIDAVLRSHIQHQGEVASYVFSGSQPGMMEQLFEDKDRPLYGSAVPLRLHRLRSEDIAAYVIDRLRGTNRSAGDALNPLLQTADGHPQRAILLAHHLWERLEEGATGTFADWSLAHAAALAELEPEFDAHWRSFGTTEQKALRAVLAGGGSPLGARVLGRLDLDKATAHKALRRLAAAAEVERTDGPYTIVDPLFAEWIERMQGDAAGLESPVEVDETRSRTPTS
jgi:hypothetical protein